MKDIIQKKWLQLLTQAMNNELSLCALYARYAELFPEQAETWLVLSRSEEKHAALLRALLAGELAEVAEIPMDKLQSGPMDFITTQVASMIEKAATGEVMPTRAIANGLLLESSLAENFLFDISPADGSFRMVAEQLCRESKYHHQLIKRLQTGEAYSTEMPAAPEELAPEVINPAAAVDKTVIEADSNPGTRTLNSLSKLAVIGAMARHEETVAQLYRTYAELFPEMAAFWLQLAEEEIGHAEILRAIGVRIKTGELDFAVEQLDLETVRTSTAFLDNQLIIARRDRLDADQALRIAKTLEEKTIEVQAFSVFSDDSASPKLRTAFAALREQEIRHRKAIDQMIAQGGHQGGKGFFKRLFGSGK